MYNYSVGLRIISVLVLTGFGLGGAPLLENTADAAEVDSKSSSLHSLSPHSISLEELSPDEIVYIEVMQERYN